MTWHILHVDDEPDIREIAALSLSLDPRFETTSAQSGSEALEFLREAAFDLVLLDMMMPEMDGPDTLAALRAAGHEVPVVFMTASAQTNQVDRLRAAGAKGVITKPFDPMSLAAELAAFLQ